MGRSSIQNETPDLFPTGSSLPVTPPESLSGRPSRKPALPKDLPKALGYLSDAELDWLLRAAIQEAKRRGRPMPISGALSKNTRAGSSEPISKASTERANHERQIASGTGLTKGQANAVWAAFKAGVTPARIARQFGLSQADVRKALSSNQDQR
jgi:hypothetical protein